jgi:hypothetical protein
MTTLREMLKLDAKTPVIEGPEKKLPLLPRLLGASLSGLLRGLAQGLEQNAAGAAGPDGLVLQYRQ